jgi:hypothetical protein
VKGKPEEGDIEEERAQLKKQIEEMEKFKEEQAKQNYAWESGRSFDRTYRNDQVPIGEPEVEKSGKGNSSGGLMGIILPVLVSVVIAFGMIQFMVPSSNAYQADITRLENDLVAIRSTNDNLNGILQQNQDRIEVLENASLENVDLSGYAEKDDVSALQTQYDGISAEIAAIKTDIATLQADNSGSGDSGSEEASGSIEVDIKYMDSLRIEAGTDTTTQAVPIMVRNNLDKDIKDVVLSMALYAQGGTPALVKEDCTCEGYPMRWTTVIAEGSIVAFAGENFTDNIGLEIEAGDSTTIYASVTLTVDAIPSSDITYYIETSVEGYEIDA